jgi:ribosomal protein L11
VSYPVVRLIRRPSSFSVFRLEDDKDAHVPIKLISKDGKSFTVERKHATISALVAAALDNGRKETDVEVPLPGVMGDTLELVVQYMKEHKGTTLAIPRWI